ncbi:MAG: 1-acyl-sn-glycerol-3-phosphate acyltransferase [Bacteroidales bacterium]|nr:1-acyl-sn-glycerol-3-phosphate acyltransferase [Bacteroidales bacterium]
MISFENVNKSDWRYNLMYKYVHFVHNHIYYKQFTVLHPERIPSGKPVVAICNHQNGLTDALGILFAFAKDGRKPVFIARADIFKKEIAAKALRFLKIMPAFRARDVGSAGVGENDAIFNQSAEILKENGVVALFPEAGHQDRHFLGTFKKGFARIAFRAAEQMDFKEPVYILPMSNHYDNYFSVHGRLVISIGEPFEFSDLYELYKEQPHRAEKILTDRARVYVKDLMLDISNTKWYDEYELLCSMYGREIMKREGLSQRYFPNHLKTSQRVVEMLDKCEKEDPQKFERLMENTRLYNKALDKMHLRDWIFANRLKCSGFFLRMLLSILLLPFIVIGWVINIVPFSLSSLVTRNIKDFMLHSSFHFAVGALVSYPLWYIITTAVLWSVTGVWWIALIYLVALPLSLVIYLRSKVMLKKFYNRIRRFRMSFRGERYYFIAVDTRKKIMKEMKEIDK